MLHLAGMSELHTLGLWIPPNRQIAALPRVGEFPALKRLFVHAADLTAKYVHFACAEGYSASIDMPTALHPQTQMTFRFDGEVLPARLGFPLRIRIPTKLGFKNPKHVVGLSVLNVYTGGYWEDRGYNWFSGS